MKYLLWIIISLLFCASAIAKEGGKGGGAGCPQSDGTIITLLECGAYHEPIISPPKPPGPPLRIDGPSEIPEGLAELINYIKTYPYLEQDQKEALLNAIQPTFYRKYFYVDFAPDLTQTIVDRIKGQFERVTGLHPSQLILYGVTDTNATMSHSDRKVQITYLLPTFKQLKTMEEKMTALLHESYWVLHPNATYLDVVTAEMSFEASMQKPNDTVRQIEYVRNIYHSPGDTEDQQILSPKLMQLLLKRDLETGALKGFLNSQNQVTNIQLFGAENIKCIKDINNMSGYISSRVDPEEICRTQFLNFRDSLLRSYPQSLFLESLKYIPEKSHLSDWNGYHVFDPTLEVINILTGGENNFLEFLGHHDQRFATISEQNFESNGYTLEKNSEPMFSKLFTWGKAKAHYHRKCINWYYTGPSSETVYIELSTDLKDPGPFKTQGTGQICDMRRDDP